MLQQRPRAAKKLTTTTTDKHRKLKGGEKKADLLGHCDPKNNIMSSLDFLFASEVPDLELKKLEPGISNGQQTKIHSTKSLLPVAKQTEKR